MSKHTKRQANDGFITMFITAVIFLIKLRWPKKKSIYDIVSPKFIELCMETPWWCPSEGHQHGGRKITETSVIVSVAIETKSYNSRAPTY